MLAKAIESAASIQIIKMCEKFSKLNNKVLLITSNVVKENVFDFCDKKKFSNYKV